MPLGESVVLAASLPCRLALSNPQVLIGSSTTGVKRYTTYLYPTGNSDPSLKEGVLLELGSRGGTQPWAVHRYRSLVAEHAISVLKESEGTWEEFAAFDVNVLAPERTLFEKLAAVHDAAAQNDRDALLKHGRHFYDIHCLLQNKQVIDALEARGDATPTTPAMQPARPSRLHRAMLQ